MRRVAWTAAMVLLGYLAVRAVAGGCSGTLPKAGTVAPAWQAEDALGRGTWSAASFNGRPYTLLFWATWCSACSRELPAVARVMKERPDVRFVLVTDEPAAKVNAYLKKRNLDLPVAVGGGATLRAFGVSVLPSAVGVDATGAVFASSQGGGAMGRLLRRAAADADAGGGRPPEGG